MSGTGLEAGDITCMDLPSWGRQTREKVNNVPVVTNKKPSWRKLDMCVSWAGWGWVGRLVQLKWSQKSSLRNV